MAISMLKIRRPLGRLIFNMGIAIPGKTVFLIETAPRRSLDQVTIVSKLSAHVNTNSLIDAPILWALCYNVMLFDIIKF